MTTANITISFFLLIISFCQFRISGAKTRIDLYNKRFEIYLSTLNYYQAIMSMIDHHENEEWFQKTNIAAMNFIKSCRESKFLFKKEDKIFDILENFRKDADCFLLYYRENKKENKDRTLLKNLFEQKLKSIDNFEKNLLELEKNMQKYLQFDTIEGWGFPKFIYKIYNKIF